MRGLTSTSPLLGYDSASSAIELPSWNSLGPKGVPAPSTASGLSRELGDVKPVRTTVGRCPCLPNPRPLLCRAGWLHLDLARFCSLALPFRWRASVVPRLLVLLGVLLVFLLLLRLGMTLLFPKSVHFGGLSCREPGAVLSPFSSLTGAVLRRLPLKKWWYWQSFKFPPSSTSN